MKKLIGLIFAIGLMIGLLPGMRVWARTYDVSRAGAGTEPDQYNLEVELKDNVFLRSFLYNVNIQDMVVSQERG